MAEFSRILKRLKERQVREATEGLRTPKSRDSFELGRLSGIQQGLAIAHQLIEEALAEDENHDSDVR